MAKQRQTVPKHGRHAGRGKRPAVDVERDEGDTESNVESRAAPEGHQDEGRRHSAAAKVRGNIARDLGSAGTGVVVTVTDGVTTLSGAVPTRAAHDAALDVARGTESVVRVEDKLRVSAPWVAPPAP